MKNTSFFAAYDAPKISVIDIDEQTIVCSSPWNTQNNPSESNPENLNF